ncbi:unnamed protein product [Rotaria sp. Silwood1]|nr:unnamed protein product [Rotaria sp. Silwood1]CAF3495012.1 unnamed protein product [Rotaria sp. Silwood1]CAF4569294.1 unnamed protein product [Rotaria sp. Silwood1]
MIPNFYLLCLVTIFFITITDGLPRYRRQLNPSSNKILSVQEQASWARSPSGSYQGTYYKGVGSNPNYGSFIKPENRPDVGIIPISYDPDSILSNYLITPSPPSSLQQSVQQYMYNNNNNAWRKQYNYPNRPYNYYPPGSPGWYATGAHGLHRYRRQLNPSNIQILFDQERASWASKPSGSYGGTYYYGVGSDPNYGSFIKPPNNPHGGILPISYDPDSSLSNYLINPSQPSSPQQAVQQYLFYNNNNAWQRPNNYYNRPYNNYPPGSQGWYATGVNGISPVPGRAITTPFATRAGIVKAGNWGDAYGTHIIIESKDAAGKVIRHLYAHLSQKMVSVGASVKAEQQIAKSGNTGRSTGPHLHYEERVSPFAYANHRNTQFNK